MGGSAGRVWPGCCDPLWPAIRKPISFSRYRLLKMVEIRAYKSDDWPAVLGIVEPVFLAGRTYAIPTDLTEAEAHDFWIEKAAVTFVAIEPEGRIVGTYFLKTKRPGPADHVANCGHIVDPDARGQKVASACAGIPYAKRATMAFTRIQYNFMLKTRRRLLSGAAKGSRSSGCYLLRSAIPTTASSTPTSCSAR